MNVISHRAAYSLFPNLTFGSRVSCIIAASPSVHNSRWTAVQQKYAARGLSFVLTVPDNHAHDQPIVRWVGDAKTWSIHFAADDNEPTLDAQDTVTLNAFQLSLSPSSELLITFDILRDPSMRFAYTTVDQERAMLRVVWEKKVKARARTANFECVHIVLEPLPHPHHSD